MLCPELKLAGAADVRHIQKCWALCAKKNNMLEVPGSSWYMGLIDCTPVWLICQSSSANRNHTWLPLGAHTIHGSRSIWTFWTFFPENRNTAQTQPERNPAPSINIHHLNKATAVQVILIELDYWTTPLLVYLLLLPCLQQVQQYMFNFLAVSPGGLCLSAPLGSSWAGHCYLHT